jgi:hypothetical protein
MGKNLAMLVHVSVFKIYNVQRCILCQHYYERLLGVRRGVLKALKARAHQGNWQLQFPRKIGDFRQVTGFQISRRGPEDYCGINIRDRGQLESPNRKRLTSTGKRERRRTFVYCNTRCHVLYTSSAKKLFWKRTWETVFFYHLLWYQKKILQKLRIKQAGRHSLHWRNDPSNRTEASYSRYKPLNLEYSFIVFTVKSVKPWLSTPPSDFCNCVMFDEIYTR